MQLGLFTEFQCPAGMSEARAFDESMAQMLVAHGNPIVQEFPARIHQARRRMASGDPAGHVPKGPRDTGGLGFRTNHPNPLTAPCPLASGP